MNSVSDNQTGVARRSSVVGLLLCGLLIAGCATARQDVSEADYASVTLDKLLPLVQADLVATRKGQTLTIAETRALAEQSGIDVSIGPSRTLTEISIDFIYNSGQRKAYAMSDGPDCLFALLDTTTDPAVANWVLVTDIYTATETVPSAVCAAEAFWGVDTTGITLSSDPMHPTRLG